ncbi:hypothetical protein STIUS_v1c03830 [Spiroplasma sp. TIUS-1]|uniref:hypothetical protein n=1 Tax=Spiroplasma sp. TIUS-1 TaxID=216963 RepID=UPI00139894E7|nr:hypothetical protein [Spiroplasma sp. TIUS-1]QHX35937.1 hypothetical protein STIUS_v1c03830 [Spiroplasma sp. TIUS-1]
MTSQIINIILIFIIFSFLMFNLFKFIKNKLRINKFQTEKKFFNKNLYITLLILFFAALLLEMIQLIMFIAFIFINAKWIEWTSMAFQLVSLSYFIVLLLISNKMIRGIFVLVFENNLIFIENVVPIDSIHVITNNLKRTTMTISFVEGEIIEVIQFKYHWKLKDLFKEVCGEKYHD